MSRNHTSEIIPSLVAGSINGILLVVSSMALASLIFTGPLSPYLSQGIGILLVGSAVFAVFSALTASHPLLVISPQDIPIAILALMAASIAAGIGDELSTEEAYRFVFVAIGLTSVLVGVFFWILGHFKLGKLVRFVPFPVVGGFLAGTGWIIVKFSVTMMTGVDLTLANTGRLIEVGVLVEWLPGLFFAVALLLASRRFSHHLVIPGVLVLGVVVFYATFFGQGLSFSDLEGRGLLLGPFPEGGLFPGLPLQHVRGFRWDLFVAHLPAAATMMILSAISLLLNYSGFELISKTDFDLDRELRWTAYGNVLAGMAGSSAGYLTLSETSLAHKLGARSRLPSMIAAIFCGVALVFGAQVLSVFPRVILGGLLLNLGLLFLVEWLWDTWGKLQKSDYLVIVFILVGVGTLGFLEGIAIGLLASVVLFAVNYSKVEVIRYELSGLTFSSNVERSGSLQRLLKTRGDQIYILPLQGFIFFGTANRLVQRVSDRIGWIEGDPLTYLLFDFRQVTGFDSSAVNSFHKLRLLAENNGFQVLLCGMSEDMERQLEVERLIPDRSGTVRSFVDLDHGVEWCEEQIIRSSLPGSGAASSAEKDIAFGDWFGQIADYLEVRDVPAGTTIIVQEKDPKGVHFLVSGHVTVKLDSGKGKQIRLKRLGPGTVVGEVSLYLETKASASVVTDERCQIRFLSKESFIKMNLEAPEKASKLHTYVVKLLSERLTSSNATIRALMR